MCGNHASAADAPSDLRRTLRIPLTLPISALTNTSARWLNALYFRRARTDSPRQRQHYQDFHFPLDRILEWNRLYGPRGFFQYQCAIPSHNAAAAVNEMLERMASARHGSFVSVLKKFGNLESLGMLSFARPGVTFALDLPNRGAATLRLLEALDTITQQAGGVVYPAKDARMSARSFQTYFPAWVDFRRYIDPHFSSSFWRRVTAQSA
jgi:FAD/FMN-containing dehydrogenase